VNDLDLAMDQGRLAECIAKLAKAIAAGEVTPAPVELEALAVICDANHLDVEAARVRRWLSLEAR
jgi:hypothetical protein